MNRTSKRILIGLGIVFLIFKSMEWWAEYRFQSLINAKPDRAYDIQYKDFDLHTFFKGVTLEEVSIVPVAIDSGTVVRGNVNYARLEGLVWYELVFGRRLDIDEILFERPTFVITLSEKKRKKTSSDGLQGLFGDILSRANLTKFEIDEGSVILMEPNNEKVRGRLSNFNLLANDIKTDSVIISHMVPFELGEFHVSIDSLSYELNEYTHLSSGVISYNKAENNLSLHDLQMKYLIDWKEVSRKTGKQIDLMEVSIREFILEDLIASSEFYKDFDVEARKLVLSDLFFVDYRDKNMPRPPDHVKTMFKGMIDAIPFKVDVDTIQLRNAEVHYTELGEGKTEAGTLRFEKINGNITRLTTLPEEQERYQSFEAKLSASLNGIAKVNFDLTVPYSHESFYLVADVGEMDMTRLNETTRHLAGIEIHSGESSQIHFEMQASEQTSKNKLRFDYENLKIEMVNEGEDHSTKKHPFISAIANSAIRNHNLPDQGKYLTADYVSTRNQYRGPFNFMWQSLSEGMIHIVPGTFVQKIIGVDKESKNQKKHKKNKK